jgi:hypothetical protein
MKPKILTTMRGYTPALLLSDVLAGLPVETIAGRFGELPRALPWPQIPPITLDRLIALLPSALISPSLPRSNRCSRPSWLTG